jgi:hypothetical protein
MPDAVTALNGSQPFFVSAGAATNPDGSIKWSALDESTRLVLQGRDADRAKRGGVKVAAIATSSVDAPCDQTILSLYHVGGNVHSLESMLSTAAAVYRGRVTGKAEGFNGTNPSTLLRIEITRALRTSPGLPNSGPVEVLYPTADFSIEGKRFCNAGLIPGFAPAIGDEVLLFPYDPPRDTTGTFLNIQPQQLIFERAGRLYVARPMTADANRLHVSTLRDFEVRIRTAADERKVR